MLGPVVEDVVQYQQLYPGLAAVYAVVVVCEDGLVVYRYRAPAIVVFLSLCGHGARLSFQLKAGTFVGPGPCCDASERAY